MIKLTTDKSVTHEEISHYAYLLWEADGKPEGKDIDYWVKAETILYSPTGTRADSLTQAKPAGQPTKAPKKKTVRASATTTASKAKKPVTTATKSKASKSSTATAKAAGTNASSKKTNAAKTPSKPSKKKS
jgi:hypothetical protein